jgi:hypothetical protein
MNKKRKKIVYNLMFAALLGLGSIPPMLTIHLLSQKISIEKSWKTDCLLEQQQKSLPERQVFHIPYAE